MPSYIFNFYFTLKGIKTTNMWKYYFKLLLNYSFVTLYQSQAIKSENKRPKNKPALWTALKTDLQTFL